jgi:hypothetical protein
MTRPLLIYIAAALTLITCIGHIIGTFMTVPADQIEVHAAISVMTATMVPMPVGASRSYMQILDGNNICTSLLLFVLFIQLVTIARLPSSRSNNRVILISAFGLSGFAAISAAYFFPIPAITTSIAAGLCLIAWTRPSV